VERILLDITTRVVTLAAGALGVEAKGFRVLREKKALILSEDASTGDSQRIGVHIGLQGAAGESTLRLYFAGVKPPDLPRPAGAPKETNKGTLTTSMSEVDVSVHAELGTAIVPLQDLLALEVGDVIVLDTLVGGPVTVAAEGRMRARAELGRHDGRLAVRLRSIEKDNRTTSDGK
jgi:flagellar motor switch/type III secretory pathway protein FliN